MEQQRGRWILMATILGSSMGFIDATAVNVALPALTRELHADIAAAQWVVEVYALFVSSLMLLSGSLADRFGRRNIFMLGTAVFAGASILCGLAQSAPELIAARAVQGIGAAMLVPSSLAIIGACFEGAQRGAAIGTWSAFSAMTGAVGPVLGGVLVDHLSWRWIFFVNVPIAVAIIALSLRWVPESRTAQPAPLDGLGASLATGGLGAFVYALVQASIGGWHTAQYVTLGAGVVLLVAFVVWQRRAPHAMMPLDLFRSPVFSGANALTLFLYGALGAAMFYIPFDLISVQHYSATAAGAALLPTIGAIFLLSRWFGTLAARVGARMLLIAGPAIAALGFVLFALPGIGGSFWVTFFPAALVLGIGMAVTVAPLTTVVLESAGADRSGLASGINNTVSRVAALVTLAALSLVLVAAAHAANPQISDPLRDLSRSGADDAFVAGFRAVMIGAALLAALASLCAAITIRR